MHPQIYRGSICARRPELNGEHSHSVGGDGCDGGLDGEQLAARVGRRGTTQRQRTRSKTSNPNMGTLELFIKLLLQLNHIVGVSFLWKAEREMIVWPRCRSHPMWRETNLFPPLHGHQLSSIGWFQGWKYMAGRRLVQSDFKRFLKRRSWVLGGEGRQIGNHGKTKNVQHNFEFA